MSYRKPTDYLCPKCKIQTMDDTCDGFYSCPECGYTTKVEAIIGVKDEVVNYEAMTHNVTVLRKLEKVLGGNGLADEYEKLMERSKQLDEAVRLVRFWNDTWTEYTDKFVFLNATIPFLPAFCHIETEAFLFKLEED